MKEERNVNVIEEIEEEVVDTTEISEEPKKESIFKRGFTAVKRGIKRHPKLTAALALLLVGGVSYALGTKVKPNNEDDSTDGENTENLIGYDEDDEPDEDYDEEDESESDEEDESEEAV